MGRKLVDNTALIDDLGVGRYFQRQGIGTQLVNFVIDWARSDGLSALKVITQANNFAAAATYRAAGFEETAGEYLYFEKKLLDGD
ncbi:GNAT family N-acetyltransferase [Candidatus Saccharibacteria bacterium]|nr:GNAT family N-acetyltransferase [Candidatus Saccharibacteria bacterium]